MVTPEGRAQRDLPKNNIASEYEEGESQKAVFSNQSLTIAVSGFIALACIFYYVIGQNIIYSGIYASGITLAGLILSDSSLSKVERDRILVIYVVSFFVIFFLAAF